MATRTPRAVRHGVLPTAVLLLAVSGCSDGTADRPLVTNAITGRAPGGTSSTPKSASAPTSASASASASRTAGTGPSGSSGDRLTRLGLRVPPFLDADAELGVDDQTGTGLVVRVEDARVTRREGFVAVFTRDGELLGSAAVTPTVQPVTVTTQRIAAGTSELTAVLFADNGDDRLDVGVDPPVVDDDGDFETSDFDYTVS